MKELVGVDAAVFPLIDKIPKRFRKSVYAAATFLGVTGVAATCGGSSSPDKTADGGPVRPEAAQNLDPNRFLKYPVPRDERFGIQQGWKYSFSAKDLHLGIDYIMGDVDNSDTWKSFPVMAAADGGACVNPPNREGTAVFIRHDRPGGKIYYTYYGHLSETKSDIPQCVEGEKVYKNLKHVSQGEGIGKSGSSGVVDASGNAQPSWVHLHFGVIGPDGAKVDPYDIRSTRDKYPDLLFNNNLTCGDKTLWVNCPTGKQAETAPTRALVPTLAPIETVEVSIIPTVAPKVETRSEEIERKWNEAVRLGQRFVSLMMDGSNKALFEAQAMEITSSETRYYPSNSYDIAPLSDLVFCSIDMREGQFQKWSVQKLSNGTRVYRGESAAERLNRQQGLLPNDRYAVGLQFTFNHYNIEARARVGFHDYGESQMYQGDYMIFEDTGNDLKLAKNEFCFGIPSPIGGQYDYIVR